MRGNSGLLQDLEAGYVPDDDESELGMHSYVDMR